jgi:hypothetical protein
MKIPLLIAVFSALGVSSSLLDQQHRESGLNRTMGFVIFTVNHALDNYGGDAYKSIQAPAIHDEIKALAGHIRQRVIEIAKKVKMESTIHRRDDHPINGDGSSSAENGKSSIGHGQGGEAVTEPATGKLLGSGTFWTILAINVIFLVLSIVLTSIYFPLLSGKHDFQ